MKRVGSFVIIFVLVTSLMPDWGNAADLSYGSSCPKIKLTKIYNSKKYVCLRKNKKMIEKGTIYPTVDPSVLAIKGDLYPKLWDNKTKKLNSDISLKLKQIAEDFVRGFEYPIKIRDIILTGSIANFNWNQFSDVDLHVLLDFNEIPDEYRDAFEDYFNAKKEIWNKTHNIMILGHEVEVYIQDINEPHYSTGVYSILNDKWISSPTFKKQDINYDDVINKTESFMQQVDKISQLVSNTV